MRGEADGSYQPPWTSPTTQENTRLSKPYKRVQLTETDRYLKRVSRRRIYTNVEQGIELGKA